MPLAWTAAQTQTPISAYADNACLYADVTGDGVMEHLEKLNRTVYDYPAGVIPNIPEDGRYFTLITEDRTNIKIVDGVYYYYCEYDPYSAMNEDLPADREPDKKVKVREYEYEDGVVVVYGYYYRFTSQEDVNAWLGVPTSDSPMVKVSGVRYKDGKLYGIVSDTAPSHYDTRVAWVDFSGVPALYIDGSEELGFYSTEEMSVYDYNGDGRPDVLLCKKAYDGSADKSPYEAYMAYSGNDGYTLTAVNIPDRLDGVVADINRDGRMDIFGMWQTWVAGQSAYEPKACIQLADGTFELKPFDVVTEKAELENAMYAGGGSGAFTVGSGRDILTGAWLGDAGFGAVGEVQGMQVVDINRDGYPDFIDPSGNSFMSLPDGRYYSATLSGTITPCDLNGDGQSDLIIYDNKKGTVTLRLSDGNSFKETKLIDNNNISAVYCRDLDGDGLLDILLEMDTPARDKYAYQAFFRNNGDGTFKRTVRTFEADYTFLRPLDFNNNGRPTVVTYDKGSGKYLRMEWDASFAVTTSDLLESNLSLVYHNNVFFKDLNGDGCLDMLAWSSDQNGLNGGHVLYTPKAEKANTAPNRPAAPRVIADKQSTLLKVEWDEVADKESASDDLRYTVEITGAGKTQLLRDTKDKWIVANTGTWPLETMSVRVRATDPNGSHGAWSEASTFENTVASALFTTDRNRMTTSDTITVTSLAAGAVTYAMVPDGKIVEQNGKAVKIVFATAGYKTIEATLAGGNAHTEKVYVAPFKYVTRSDYQGSVFDLDLDGVAEGYNDKLHKFENGKFAEYPAFSLSDVYIYADFIADYNMDGLPDLFGRHYKSGSGNVYYPCLVNGGDLEFERVEQLPTDPAGNVIGEYSHADYVADYDNDGRIDFWYDQYMYRSLGGSVYEKVALPENKDTYYTYPNDELLTADLNRDGNIDIVAPFYTGGSWASGYMYAYYVYRNNGNMNFTLERLPEANGSPNRIVDVNGDGYPDIVYHEGNDEFTGYNALLSNSEMAFGTPIDLPGKPLMADMDNDGLVDYQICEDTIMLGSGFKTAIDFDLHFVDINNLQDANGDGTPDLDDSYVYSRFVNTAPTAPTEVYANMQGNNVVINWTGATDAETAVNRLRYNISVRKKGATGPGSYVISPLNGTSDKALAGITGAQTYRIGASMTVPMERFEAGQTYEIQVQTIDPWYAHSPFSKVFEYTPSAQALISMAQKGGVGQMLMYTVYDNSGAEPVIDADGGRIQGNTITWDTPGLKTVKVTAGAATAEHKILIAPQPDLTLNFPARILAGTTVTMPMPEAVAGNEGAELTYAALTGLKVQLNTNDNTISLSAERNGTYSFVLKYTDDIFTEQVTKIYEVEVVGEGFRPELTSVGVDGATGRNRIAWNAAMTLPDASLFTGKVAVYRETSVSDKYEMIGEVPVADGSFIDTDSRPDTRSYRYVITLPTTYGIESVPSAVHGNIHLMVNRGLGNDINLHWTPYTGADIEQYTVFAGTSKDNLTAIETLSGHSMSYTHRRTSDAVTYYSIAYRVKGGGASGAKSKAPAAQAGGDDAQSNVISSAEAYAVTMVQGIGISSSEGVMSLDETFTRLHLTAEVLPLTATLARVEWSIVEGESLATIDADGLLTIKDNTTGGTVTVRARAIDGSGVEQTATVSVSSYTNGIAGVTEDSAPEIILGRGCVTIGRVTGRIPASVVDLQGRLIFSSSITADRRIDLAPGFYIVRAGATVKKVFVR